IVGSLDLNSTFDQIAFQGSTGADKYTLVTYSGTLSGTFDNFPTLPSGYMIDYSTLGEIDLISSTPVPEPGTWASAAFALAALIGLQRRRIVRLLKRKSTSRD